MLPFAREPFLDLFGAYNQAVWPAQPVGWALGLAALAALAVRRDWAHRVALAVLAAMWLWTGLAYHWLFFSEINPAAILFGALFVAEGALLGLLAVRRPLAFRFAPASGAAALLGSALIFYAAIVYPLVDLVLGHWPRMPAFGISPCPVTLFTLGMLLLAQPRPTAWLWVAPVAWSLIGGTAAFLLGIPQDWVLLFAGPVAAAVALRRAAPEAGGLSGSRGAA